MATTITITGSGSSIPSAVRAGPGVLVQSDGVSMQIDAGRGTVMRLAGVGIQPHEIDVVFVTHHHSDHLVGLPDLVMTRWIMADGETIEPLPIVAPQVHQ